MLIREGEIQNTTINAFVERRFFIDIGMIKVVTSYQKTKKYIFPIKVILTLAIPLLLLNFYVAIFSIFNTYDLQLLTQIYIVFMAIAVIYGLITISPRKWLTTFVMKSIKQEDFKKTVEKHKDLKWYKRLMIDFVINGFEAYVANLPTDKTFKTIRFNSTKFFDLMDNSLALSTAIFFLLNSEITFSLKLFQEFSIMVFLGIPDMLFSGIVTASGISFGLSYDLTQVDKILLAIMNVSLFSAVFCVVFKNLGDVERGDFYFKGNYSKLEIELSYFRKAPIGVVVIYDYGPIYSPYASPCLWYVDDIQMLKAKELNWAHKNIENLHDLDDREKWRHNYHAVTHRGFRKLKNIDLNNNKVEYYLNVSSIYLFRGKPVVCFYDSTDFSQIQKIIIYKQSNIIELEDSLGNKKPIPFQTIFPFNFVTNKEGICTFIHEKHDLDLSHTGTFELVE
ncbi:hypothetical protein GLIP_2043 [Aliiglaciecola lipolytica E3]|uniref:Uncharacterized protein n=1 Tax=Aliiglaciecola lipolytica E3 TaxID=1127673 RepID=K6XSL0_9ALTE|nr:hypothetical protein GLIP_2043 [Aliiglaciecola lipolytica E3]